ncbi:hypothetical protein HU200_052430 [Digitaria exilis]|uniref:Uncharacterized protein n=1 Tax=Digitaria exilis TaxID=1010633 RepID=A0A835APX8_9POAL|nr:hypothetical protein HU200_052430 [Digitaria exilis]
MGKAAAAGIIFLMATTTVLLPTWVLATRSMGRRRSRFLATFDTSSCSYTGRCPDIVDPHGFRYPGAQCCDGVCVNTEFDANQCGECNYACQVWPWICCHGVCVNNHDDPANCGGCDNFCWDAGCFNGICGYAV